MPALNGFVGEYVILQGAFQASPWAAAFAAFGMVLSAVYLLTMFQKVFLGVPAAEAHVDSHDHADPHSSTPAAALADLSFGEVLGTAPLLALCAIIGLYSWPFFNLMNSSVTKLLTVAGVMPK